MLRFIETALHFVAYFISLLSGLSPNLRGCCDYPRVALGIVSGERTAPRTPPRCAHFSSEGTPYPRARNLNRLEARLPDRREARLPSHTSLAAKWSSSVTSAMAEKTKRPGLVRARPLGIVSVYLFRIASLTGRTRTGL